MKKMLKMYGQLLVVFALMLFVHHSQALAAEGDVWLVPANQTLQVSQPFEVELHMDSGAKDIGAFNVNIDFNNLLIAIDTAQGNNGITPGADAVSYSILANSASVTSGHFQLAGICAQGCASGSDVHIATIYARSTVAFLTGTTQLSVQVNQLTDTISADLASGTYTGAQVTSNGVDTTPPVISEDEVNNSLSPGTTNATVRITTNEPATCRYDTNTGVSYTSMANEFSVTGGTTHEMIVTNLTSGEIRDFSVRCLDVAGNVNTADYAFTVAVPISLDDEGGTDAAAPRATAYDDPQLQVSDSLVPCGSEGTAYTGECRVCHLLVLAMNVLNFFVIFSVLVATLLFVYAGVLYVTSPTNPGNISKGHRVFLNTLIGFLIILAAFLIVNLLMSTFYEGSDLANFASSFANWNEMLNCGPGLVP